MTSQQERILNALAEHLRQNDRAHQDSELEQRIQQSLPQSAEALVPLTMAAINAQASFEYAQVQLQQVEAQLQAVRQELAQLRGQQPPPAHTAPQPQGGKITSFLNDFFGGGTPTAQGPPLYAGQPQQGQGYAPVSSGTPQTPPYQPVNAPGGYPQQSQGYPQQGQGYPQAWPPQQPYPQPTGFPQQAAYGQPYAPAGYPQPGYAPSYGWGSPGGGMVSRIAETAAGVAAGAIVAEGVESMLHSFGHEHERERAYDSPAAEHHTDAPVDSSFYNPQHDASRDLSPDTESADRNSGGAADFVDEASAGDWQDVSGNDESGSADDGDYDSGGDDSN